MPRKLTQKEVLERFKKVHEDKYDYSLVEYGNNRTDIIIICHKHGKFLQKPEKHILGRGCSECGIIRSKENNKFSQKEVLDRFKKVHGDEYDYSLVEYEGANNKIKIRCFLHGSFQQIPYEHWSGQGCPQCGILKRSNSRRKTTEQFIEGAKLVHENFYDYSESIYNGNKNKIKIICPSHGIFEQTPNSHLKGSRCIECAKISYRLKRGKKENEFIFESEKIHGEIYNYQNVVYLNINAKVKIGCNIHGEFKQLPVSHLKGHGCKKCGNKLVTDKTRKTQEEFIRQASSIHDNYYKYDNIEYKSDNIKIKITCPIHGNFEQVPSNHLQGSGCKKCGIKLSGVKQRLSLNQFLESAKNIHGNVYDYSKINFETSKDKIIIICKVHGEFEQEAGSHLQGKGCIECGFVKTGNKLTKSHEEFLQDALKVHKNRYDYSKAKYVKDSDKVIIICKVHGEFEQGAGSHTQGSGCQKCYNKNEGRLAVILNEIGVVHRQYKIENKRYDFYLPDYNILIERDGEQHYRGTDFGGTDKNENLIFQQNNDQYKTNLAKSKDHKICRIPYWLREEDERKEIQNILKGQPTYPDVPDLEQAKTKPLPK